MLLEISCLGLRLNGAEDSSMESKLTGTWHQRLASRIFGEIQRFMAQKVNIRVYKHLPQHLMLSVPLDHDQD
jgi:hypothetical protein